MNPEQLQSIRVRLAQAKEQAEICLAAFVMLERNLRELSKQIHIVHMQMQEGK